eukprot:COSAG04_NODE_923_length_9382_cov_2.751481_4_plen_70_part_00
MITESRGRTSPREEPEEARGGRGEAASEGRGRAPMRALALLLACCVRVAAATATEERRVFVWASANPFW